MGNAEALGPKSCASAPPVRIMQGWTCGPEEACCHPSSASAPGSFGRRIEVITDEPDDASDWGCCRAPSRAPPAQLQGVPARLRDPRLLQVGFGVPSGQGVRGPPCKTPVDAMWTVDGGATAKELVLPFSRRPLGLDISKTKPVTVGHVLAGSHAEDLGVRVGWRLLSVNGEDVAAFDHELVLALLRQGAAQLPASPAKGGPILPGSARGGSKSWGPHVETHGTPLFWGPAIARAEARARSERPTSARPVEHAEADVVECP